MLRGRRWGDIAGWEGAEISESEIACWAERDLMPQAALLHHSLSDLT